MAQLEIKPTLLKRRANISPRFVALAGMLGPVSTIAVITLAGLLRPGYSVIHQYISDLGAGHNAWILNSDFFVSGLLFITFALGFYRLMQPVMNRKWLLASTILFVLSGAGVMYLCFFHEPLPTEPAAHFYLVLHNLGFWDIFYTLILALLITGWHLWKTPAWRWYGLYSLITALVTLGLMIIPHLIAGSDHFAGLIERVLVVEAFAWSVVMGLRFFTMPPARQESEDGINGLLLARLHTEQPAQEAHSLD